MSRSTKKHLKNSMKGFSSVEAFAGGSAHRSTEKSSQPAPKAAERKEATGTFRRSRRLVGRVRHGPHQLPVLRAELELRRILLRRELAELDEQLRLRRVVGSGRGGHREILLRHRRRRRRTIIASQPAVHLLHA